ncbi:901_t:CDS:2, partial [Dentiscutata erythropus]
IIVSSSSNIVSSEEHRKQLNCKHQKWFRNKNRETISHLFDDVSEELQYLLNTEVPIFVVEPIETSAIDTNSGSDSDDLLPLPNTEVPTITNHEFINTQMELLLQNFLCCANNKVQLPPLLKPLPYLLNLYTSTNPDAVEFHKHARGYNSALACTSFGANVDNQFLRYSIANFRIHAQVYHLIGSLLPNESRTPVFAQLYIYDTANEITNHQNAMHKLNKNILQNIICDNVTTEISMIIHGDRNQDIRRYNAPTAPDVAAIMVAEFYPSYDPLHYVLLFSKENLQDVANRTKNRITILTAWFQENMQNLMTLQSLEGERYYLQTLLSYVKGATSFDDLKTINDYTC